MSSGSGFTPITRRSIDDAQDEIKRLKKKLEERDKQLREQASSLADMEASLQELQSLIPTDGSTHARNRSAGSYDDADSAQLRAIIREKNEKIAMLTAEFDAHRADFRSTIDTLEMASTETERVYEKKVEELMHEIRDLQDRGEDVESVARQLKQLEDLVQELEEGLEEARRGEADARGEAEFLRGEVERTKAELQVEREKAKDAVKSARTVSPINARDSRDIEQRDDEIRGLKAIIHSLSSASGADMNTSTLGGTRSTLQRSQTTPNDTDQQAQVERLEREKKDLQVLIDRKNSREEELERELEQLRSINSRHMSVTSNAYSDRTTTQEKRSSGRDSKGTVVNWRNSALQRKDTVPLAHVTETESASGTSTSGVLWCEICESNGHDILTCPNVDKNADTGPSCSISSSSISNNPAEASSLSADDMPMQARVHGHSITSTSPPNSQDPDMPKPLSMGGRRITPAINPTALGAPPTAPPTAPLPSPYDASLVAGKDGSRPDPNKWCALCERDGHDSINCAFEDQF
jgi:chromosome segregation ATPase